MKNIEYCIRPIRRNEWDMAMQLAWDTFLVYEAPEYEPLGVKNFHDFVKGKELKQLYLLGGYATYGAFTDDGIIVGIIGVRKENHVSLLFVEPQYHHQGIATALLEQVMKDAKRKNIYEMTVNSSPYAVQFYHKIGFEDLDREISADGIRYTPMRIKLA